MALNDPPERAGGAWHNAVKSSMAEHIPATANTESGHLQVRVDGLRAPEPTFLFERPQSRVGVTGSIAMHVLFFAVALFVAIYGQQPSVSGPIERDRPPDSIVWLSQPGPGGGGGGGGNRSPEPPKKAEVPGENKLSVPAVQTPTPKPEPPKPEPPEQPEVNIPAMTLGDAAEISPGVLESAMASATLSQGTGYGGGAGTGVGTGIGEGEGAGLGAGFGKGTGGGAYRPGNGVELPRVVREVRPQYTADAMRAKVQGTVWVECVVLPDGSVGEAHVTKSLDSVFGLDQEALKAARQWKFVPGRRMGEPVPVLVTIELTFTLR